MKITKHAQSCLLVQTSGKNILIDPGFFVFQEEEVKPADFPKIDIVLVTHEHPDHFDIDNVIEILKRDNPSVLSTANTINAVREILPAADVKVVKPGQTEKIRDISIEVLAQKHGPLPTGKPEPEDIGFVIDDGKHRFYSPGDSTYLNQEAKANIVAVPICGTVVMDIEKAKSELLAMKPEVSIPMHYDSPKYPIPVKDFIEAMRNTNQKVKVLKWGESIEL